MGIVPDPTPGVDPVRIPSEKTMGPGFFISPQLAFRLVTLVDETAFYAKMMQPGDPMDLVAAAFHRPDWMAEAGCINLAVEFVPPPRGPNKPPSQAEQAAIAVCRTCPVRQECLDYALEHHELGVWGGTTERQRGAAQIEPGRPTSATRPMQSKQ